MSLAAGSCFRFVPMMVVAFVMAGPVVPSAVAQEEEPWLCGATFPLPSPASPAVAAAPASARSLAGQSVRRPAALPALYVSLAALQALDVHSTTRGLSVGGREANPVLAGIASNRPAMIALKGGATAAAIYLSEKLWKKNRVAAIVLMVAINSASAMVVANNYRLAARAL